MLDQQRAVQLRDLGTAISPPMLQQTMALFAPHAAQPADASCKVLRDLAYAKHERHREQACGCIEIMGIKRATGSSAT